MINSCNIKKEKGIVVVECKPSYTTYNEITKGTHKGYFKRVMVTTSRPIKIIIEEGKPMVLDDGGVPNEILEKLIKHLKSKRI